MLTKYIKHAGTVDYNLLFWSAGTFYIQALAAIHSSMKRHLIFFIVLAWSCTDINQKDQITREKYLKLDSVYTKREIFSDSICEIALDSATRRFEKDKFELYAFLRGDTSGTPIHLLQKRFRLKVIGFSEKDIVFRFCYNEGMINAFVKKHKFNPIDSVNSIYDSLARIGLTALSAKFGDHFTDVHRYMYCNLEFPDDTDIPKPYPQVYVKFTISSTGEPDSIKIVRAYSKEYDNAVLKLVKKMPRWRPARGENGQYVREDIVYPVIFDPARRVEYCR